MECKRGRSRTGNENCAEDEISRGARAGWVIAVQMEPFFFAPCTPSESRIFVEDFSGAADRRVRAFLFAASNLRTQRSATPLVAASPRCVLSRPILCRENKDLCALRIPERPDANLASQARTSWILQVGIFADAKCGHELTPISKAGGLIENSPGQANHLSAALGKRVHPISKPGMGDRKPTPDSRRQRR